MRWKTEWQQDAATIGLWDAGAQRAFLKALLRVSVVAELESPPDGVPPDIDEHGQQEPVPHLDTITAGNWYSLRVRFRDGFRGTFTSVGVRVEVLRRTVGPGQRSTKPVHRTTNYVFTRVWSSVFPTKSRLCTMHAMWLVPEARTEPIEHRA